MAKSKGKAGFQESNLITNSIFRKTKTSSFFLANRLLLTPKQEFWNSFFLSPRQREGVWPHRLGEEQEPCMVQPPSVCQLQHGRKAPRRVYQFHQSFARIPTEHFNSITSAFFNKISPPGENFSSTPKYTALSCLQPSNTEQSWHFIET